MHYLKKKSNGSIGWGPMISSDLMLTRVVKTTTYYKWNSQSKNSLFLPDNNGGPTPIGRCYNEGEEIISNVVIKSGSPTRYTYTLSTCVFDRKEVISTDFGWRSGSSARDIMVRLTDGDASTIGWKRITDFTSKKGFKYITYEDSIPSFNYPTDLDVESCVIQNLTIASAEGYLNSTYNPGGKAIGYTIGMICGEFREIFEVQYV